MADRAPLIRPWPKRFQHPHDQLGTEPEADKALRLLRGFRHWVKSKQGVTCIELDGQLLLVIKYNPDRHPRVDPTAIEAEL